ncbi:MAG: ABC transporter ATP-binding protein, partial [Planctomycetes bacterium]|nr:ABC transporter ATP-binding protein [Planctomycetota bacterium]
AGLITPSQGHVTVAGKPAGSKAARAAVGFSADVDRFPEHLSAHRFLTWMLRYNGLSRRRAADRAAAVLTELGLQAAMERPLRTLSKGMRQRVRLGQALAHEPRLLLLDEPMTGLDPVARSEVAAILRQLPQRGVGVLVSSHVLHELETMVDRVVLVHQGRLLAEGRVDELRRQVPEQAHRVRVAAADPRALAARLSTWPQVRGLQVQETSIDVEVFGAHGFYEALTALGAEWPEGLQAITPLDDDLAAVFGYMIG